MDQVREGSRTGRAGNGLCVPGMRRMIEKVASHLGLVLITVPVPDTSVAGPPTNPLASGGPHAPSYFAARPSRGVSVEEQSAMLDRATFVALDSNRRSAPQPPDHEAVSVAAPTPLMVCRVVYVRRKKKEKL